MQAPTSHDPFGWVGHVLDGRYRLDAVVGAGGFGIVYRAQHVGLGHTVAVKCLDLRRHLDPAQQHAFVEAFRKEGQILAQLATRSPAIVRATDIGAAMSPRGIWTPYLVLEWLEGTTLASYVDKRVPIGLAQALRILRPVADALEIAHASGIAHRDVKPANLFAAQEPGGMAMKVLDFGVAKIMGDEALVGAYDATGQSVRAFSAAYGAPEQFYPGSTGVGATGPWTDVYALALVLVELVTARPPYEGAPPSFASQAIDPARRPTARAKGVALPDAVERLFERALAVDPRNRPPTAGAFWRELEAAAREPAASSVPHRTSGPQTLAADPMRSAPTHARAATPEMLPVSPPPIDMAHAISSPSRTTSPRTLTPSPLDRTVLTPSRRARGARPFVIAAGVLVAMLACAVSYRLAIDEEPVTSDPKGTETPSPTKGPNLPAGLLVRVPGGLGKFGAKPYHPENTYDEEGDVYETVKTFWLERYEVTVAQYRACVAAGICSPPKLVAPEDSSWHEEHCNYDDAHAKHPVTCVSRAQARRYCAAIGRRLPTYREWEFAARGTSGRTYPWGNEAPTCDHAVFGQAKVKSPENSMECGAFGTLPVGSRPRGATSLKVYDLAGNVAEWTEGEIFHKPTATKRPAVYGGAWTAHPNRLQGFRRWLWPETWAAPTTGFRCAKGG